MTNTHASPHQGGKSCRVLRILTAAFAVFGPVAVITAAAVTTLLEGDWWKGFFLACLAFYGLLLYTSYFSLLTVLWELTRRARRKNGEDTGDTPFTTVLHRILGGSRRGGAWNRRLYPPDSVRPPERRLCHHPFRYRYAGGIPVRGPRYLRRDPPYHPPPPRRGATAGGGATGVGGVSELIRR